MRIIQIKVSNFEPNIEKPITLLFEKGYIQCVISPKHITDTNEECYYSKNVCFAFNKKMENTLIIQIKSGAIEKEIIESEFKGILVGRESLDYSLVIDYHETPKHLIKTNAEKEKRPRRLKIPKSRSLQ